MPSKRRSFLAQSASSLTAVSGVLNLPGVSNADTKLNPSTVQFAPDIEPLVRLLEDTDRPRVLERVAEEIRSGASYRHVLTALFLAAIRNIQPRPSVGFKFHSVLVVNSCHLASVAGPSQDRWLPLFWAIDYFKATQADEQKRSGWQLPALEENRQIPSGMAASQQFIEAMQQWDVEGADSATVGLVRSFGADMVFEHFVRFAARDYRSIGHKAIYLANGWRTLQVIGWQHAEHVLRSLAFALLNHQGEPNPSQSDLLPDRSWKSTEALVNKIPENWTSNPMDPNVPTQLLSCYRQESAEASAILAADILQSGSGAQSVWDGVFVGAGELLMQQPGIIGLHGLTTANAMHYLWQKTRDETLRKRLLLQANAFLPQFRASAKSRGKVAGHQLDMLNELPDSDQERVDSHAVLAQISEDRMLAAKKLFYFLQRSDRAPYEFLDSARRVLFSKGRDAHDYKFCSAVLEDYRNVSPAWRDKFLATSVFHLRSSRDEDNRLVESTQELLKA